MTVTAHASGTKTPPLGTFTVTIASPGVFTYTAHGLAAGDKVTFSTTGTLPTGLVAGTTYYVISAGLTSNAFQVSATDGGAAINTSGTQSGTHSLVAELFLSEPGVAGTFTFHVDCNALAGSDKIELRGYQKVLAGGTPREVFKQTVTPGMLAAEGAIWISIPLSSELVETDALGFSLRQTLGAARAFPWKVLKYA